MYFFEMNDIFLFLKCLKDPPLNFNILKYVIFYQNSTRSGSSNQFQHTSAISCIIGPFYFNHLPLLWNSLLPLDLDQLLSTIKSQVRNYFGIISYHSLTFKIHAHIITYVLVQNVIVFPTLLCLPSLSLTITLMYLQCTTITNFLGS